MNWLDAVLAIILIASVATSFRKGLSREVIGLGSVLAAILLGLWTYGTVGGFLAPYLNSRGEANAVGFFLVFCGVLVAGALVSGLVGKFLKVTGLSFFDHLLGAAFGVARGVLVGVALIVAIMAFSQTDHPPASVVRSRMAPYMVGAARVCAAMAPHEFREGFQKSYAKVRTAWENALKHGLPNAPKEDKKSNEGQI